MTAIFPCQIEDCAALLRPLSQTSPSTTACSGAHTKSVLPRPSCTMSGTGPSTENIAFDSGHGKPVTLKEELPGYSGVGSAPPTDEFDDPPLVKRTERVETTRVSKPVGNGDEGDSELKQKVTVNSTICE
jgi:hypothetical protein